MKSIRRTKPIILAIFLTLALGLLISTLQVNAQPPVSNPACAICGAPCTDYDITTNTCRSITHKSFCKYYVSDNPGSAPDGRPRVDFSFTRPIQSGFQVGILGSLTGGLLVKGKSGEALWGEGALLGFGLGSSIALFNSINKRPVVANIALAVVAGAATGAGGAMAQKALTEPTVPAKPDNTVKYAVIAAVAEVALVTTISLTKKTKGGYSYKTNKNKFLSKMSINFYGSRIGLIVKI